MVLVTVTPAPPVGPAEVVEAVVETAPVVVTLVEETLVEETLVEEDLEVELEVLVLLVEVEEVVLAVVVAALHLSFLWVFHQAQAPANSALNSSGSSPVQPAIHIPAAAMKLP